MELSEARAVIAAILSGADDDQYVTRPQIEGLSRRMPEIDWVALAAEVDAHLAPVVSVEALRARREEVLAIAARHGLADLRWSPSERALVAALTRRIGYGDIFDAESEIAELVGGGVEIVGEAAPIVARLSDLEPL